MILFKEDWHKYPKAIPNIDTKNESFVDICYILRGLGVNNHLFPLSLHNPDIKDIDPHGENLSIEEKGLITKECFENPWYYFREVARIPVQGAMKPIKVKANRGNIALWWCYFNHITTFLVQPRQTGKSVTMANLDRYLLNFGLVHSSIHLLTKEDQLRRNDVERLKEYEEILPEYLRRTVKKKDPNNQEYIYLSAVENKYETHVPRMDEKGAYKVGRGFTSANIRIDEFAYISWLKATLTTIISATNAAFESAKENKAHHGIILATTAGKKDDRDGKYAYQILSSSFPFTEKIYDSQDENELRKTIMANSTNGYAVNCTFNHRMLGVSDQQHYDNIKKAMISGEEADRDYFNIWTSGSVGSPLTAEQLDFIRDHQTEKYVNDIDSKMRYMTKWYVSLESRDRLMEAGNVVVGIDTSEAMGKDEIAMQYVDLNTLQVLGTCYCNLTNIIEYSLWLFDQMQKWPKLTAIIERRSTGAAVIDQLLLSFKIAGQNAFKRIYNKIAQDPDRFKEELMEIRRADKYQLADMYVRYKSAFGYSTSAKGDSSRSILYGQVLQNAVRHSMDRINDIKTINQIMSLTVINGRVDHPRGSNDDGVIAWLLTIWFAMFGNNLSWYGIDPTQIMSNTMVKKDDSQMTAEERYQSKLKDTIVDLVDELTTTKDHYLRLKLESQINNLAKEIKQSDDETFNVTELIKKTIEQKKMKRNFNN